MNDIWADLQRPPPETARVGDAVLRRGSRVRVHPRANADIFDRALAGRVAIVEGIDQGIDGELQVAVTMEDDPGRDLGEGRYPGHRFFFGLGEVEPLDPVADGDAANAPRGPRLLVAGIGNIFLGDDGFGVAVAQQLAARSWPAGVDVRDFGIRGMDLAYAMQNDYDAVIFIDATPQGEAPGTLFVIDAAVDADGPMSIDTHGMDPVKVLALARGLGRVPPRVLVLGCEPSQVIAPEAWDEMDMTLSAPVADAIAGAVSLAESLVETVLRESRGSQNEIVA
ncbi:MAG TPA: hydrogenase maturation protease [Gemmatimonadaceae bacterium]|jgi:hydrogenase maturation protease